MEKMTRREDKESLEDLPGKFKAKMKKREKKSRPKMKVSGRRVFQLKRIFKTK